ncbi:hypothetical protein HWV62_30741 [Athelia sp. TMB]|nr:hypothetical protein HWV62_30741 [Athelia sp. TMB]
MNRVPAEIWTTIFSFACLDSGATGRILSRVSKFIRDASAPVRWQSLHIHGPRKVVAFHARLLRTPPHLRRVRYLFLSSAAAADQGGRSSSEKGRQQKPHSPPEFRRRVSDAQLIKACFEILVHVAESVEIMYLDISLSHLSEMPPRSIHFPLLRELTSASLPPHYGVPSAGGGAPIAALCPQLRRWHLTECPFSVGMALSDHASADGLLTIGTSTALFPAIAAIAPALAHLRFSNLLEEHWFPAVLQGALAADPPGPPRVLHAYPASRKLPASIKDVYITLAAPPESGDSYNTRRRGLEILRGRLEALSRADSRVVLLQPSNPDCQTRCTPRALFNRLNGSDDCWSPCDRISSNHQ